MRNVFTVFSLPPCGSGDLCLVLSDPATFLLLPMKEASSIALIS